MKVFFCFRFNRICNFESYIQFQTKFNISFWFKETSIFFQFLFISIFRYPNSEIVHKKFNFPLKFFSITSINTSYERPQVPLTSSAFICQRKRNSLRLWNGRKRSQDSLKVHKHVWKFFWTFFLSKAWTCHIVDTVTYFFSAVRRQIKYKNR